MTKGERRGRPWMRSGMAALCLCLVLFAAACGPRAEQGGGKSQSAAEQSPSPSGALETAAPAETEAAEAPATPEPTPAPTPTIPALAGPVTYEGQVDFFGVGESTLTFTMSADRMRLYDIALDYGDYARPDSFDDMGGFVTRSLPGGQYLYPAEIPAEEPGRFAVGSGSRALTLEVTCTDTYATGRIRFQYVDIEAFGADMTATGAVMVSEEMMALQRAAQEGDENVVDFGARSFLIPVAGEESQPPQDLVEAVAKANEDLFTVEEISVFQEKNGWTLGSFGGKGSSTPMDFHLTASQKDWFLDAKTVDLQPPEGGARVRNVFDNYFLLEPGGSLILTVEKDGERYQRSIRLGDQFAYTTDGKEFYLLMDEGFQKLD